MTPTPEFTYERAKRLANMSMWTISPQCRRLSSSEPEDNEFVFRKCADSDLMIVALTRLRRAAMLAASIPKIKPKVHDAIKRFDQALPTLRMMRNVVEHTDKYAIGRGRDQSISHQGLKVSILSIDGSVVQLEWLGCKLNTDDVLGASARLFDELKQVSVDL